MDKFYTRGYNICALSENYLEIEQKCKGPNYLSIVGILGFCDYFCISANKFSPSKTRDYTESKKHEKRGK